MRLHHLTHVPFEGLAQIEDWAQSRKLQISQTKMYELEPLPNHSDYEFLVIMGGSMSVYEEDKYKWLIEEKRFVKEAIEQGKKILGICLGSQILAEVLGAKVYKNKEKEIGFWNLYRDSASKYEFFNSFPEELKTFHWHGDTYDIPENAERLFYSDATKNQGFIYQNNVIGLQFHIDLGRDHLLNMLNHCRDDITTGEFVQSEDIIKSKLDLNTNLHKILYSFLDNWLLDKY